MHNYTLLLNGADKAMIECSIARPWGRHAGVRNDEDCPRCGWTAPGPKSDARAEAEEAAAQAWSRAEALGWDVIDGDGGHDEEASPLAA
jgi:hypothetical protein